MPAARKLVTQTLSIHCFKQAWTGVAMHLYSQPDHLFGRVRTMIDFLTGHGVTRVGAIKLASSGKGWWRLTDATQVKQAMSIAWFTALGLTSMADHHAALNLAGNRRGT